MTDHSVVTPYRAYLRQCGLRSAKHYRFVAPRFLCWMEANRLALEQVTPPVVHRYLVWRKSLGHDPQRYFYLLRTFFRWLVQQGRISQDSTQGVFCSWVEVPGGYPGYRGVLRGLFDDRRGILTYRRLMF